MTVAIIISEPLTEADVRFYVPVAAQEVFDKIWVPASEHLGLFWMPMFSTGVPTTRDDLPEVRQEFVTIRDWFAHNVEDPKAAAFLVGRANLAIAGIDQILARPDDIELFIG
jgi:hypothetical protein